MINDINDSYHKNLLIENSKKKNYMTNKTV